jgi:hypothetical protein
LTIFLANDEALEMARREPETIDVLLTDVVMLACEVRIWPRKF